MGGEKLTGEKDYKIFSCGGVAHQRGGSPVLFATEQFDPITTVFV
jgi:hypothetical protein